MNTRRRYWFWALALAGACVCVLGWKYPGADWLPIGWGPGGRTTTDAKSYREGTEAIQPIDLSRFTAGAVPAVRVRPNSMTGCSSGPVQNVIVIGHYAPALERFEASLLAWRACTAADPKRVIVVGPDHQRRLKKGFAVGDRGYVWQGEQMVLDELLQQAAIEAGAATSTLFLQEHGVAVPLMAIKRVMPSIEKVVPIVISSGSSEVEMDTVTDLLKLWAKDPETLVVFSVDFSHYLTLDQARIQDARTRQVLLSGNRDVLWSADDAMTDFGRGLWVLLSLDDTRPFVIHDTFSTVDFGGAPGYTTTFMTGWLQ